MATQHTVPFRSDSAVILKRLRAHRSPKPRYSDFLATLDWKSRVHLHFLQTVRYLPLLRILPDGPDDDTVAGPDGC